MGALALAGRDRPLMIALDLMGLVLFVFSTSPMGQTLVTTAVLGAAAFGAL